MAVVIAYLLRIFGVLTDEHFGDHHEHRGEDAPEDRRPEISQITSSLDWRPRELRAWRLSREKLPRTKCVSS